MEATARLTAPPRPRSPRPFGLEWVRRYLPHYVTAAPSRLHAELAADLSDLHVRRGRHVNRIAPRGSAKTTFASKAYPLWCVCEGAEKFVLFLSDGAEQAGAILDAVKAELESNEAIARDYPHAAGPGRVWQTLKAVSRNGVLLLAKGAGGKLRGVTRAQHRPTLVLLDDCNDDGDAFSETKRRRKLSWLDKGVMPIGGPATNFLSVGTAVHREAIPCVLAGRGGWESKSYRSILDWPRRMDLWAEWEKLYTNLADADRGQTARRFYAANRGDMDAGASVLWPDRFPLYDLMERRATSGESAFNSEYQDQPGTEGATEWPPEYFGPDIWCNALPDRERRKWTVQALDPSKGTGDKPGDYQAHVCCVLGTDGVLYFDADFRREDAKRMCERSAELADLWGSNYLVVEVNAGLGLLEAEFADLIQRGRLPNAQLKTTTNSDHKSCRIREVGMYLARRRVRVVNGQGGRELVSQWQDWPNGRWDDLPDAAGVAVRFLSA